MKKPVEQTGSKAAEDTQAPGPAGSKEPAGRIRRVKAILVLVLCISFALSLFIRSDFAQQRLLLARASLSGDPYEQIWLYRESLYLGDSLAAKKGLAQAYDAAGLWADAGELVESLLWEYPDDKWLNEFKASRIPAPPVVSVPAGTYDDNVELQFSLNDSGSEPAYYGAVLLCYQDGMQVEGSSVTLSENGSYYLTLRTRNGYGFFSEEAAYTYTIAKLIPQAAAADTPSGYYWSTVQLALTQPEGLPIYYTLDGSAPNENSALYTGTITLESGRTVLRAVACSSKGVLGEECLFWYHIKPWSSGVQDTGLNLITAHGDYFYQNGALVRYVDGTEEMAVLSLAANATAVCEFDDGFLVANGTSISRYSLLTQAVSDFAQAPDTVSAMETAGGDLFVITAANRLYRLQDGKFEEMSVRASCMSPAQDQSVLYLGGSDGIYVLSLSDGSVDKLTDASGSVSSLAAGGGCLYYCVAGRSLFQYDLSSGQGSVLREYASSSYREEPHLITNGYTESTTVSYDRVCFANGRLYFRKVTVTQSSEIPWSLPSSTTNSSTSEWKTWVVYLPGSGEAEDLGTEQLQVGNGYCRLPGSGAVVVQN